MSTNANHWPTVAAIAAASTALMVAGHESVHALTCVVVGGDLQELSSHHVECASPTATAGKLVSASASLVNVVVGSLLWLALRRRTAEARSPSVWFLWLFMTMNLLSGTGYWMLSGIANVGDWANVIEGWEPHAAWRVGMALLGTSAFMGGVAAALVALGRLAGTESKAQHRSVVRLGIVSYVTAVAVSVAAGLLHPYGVVSLPVIAGAVAVLGAQSPLLWMTHWFQAKMFTKHPGPALHVGRSTGWIAAGLVVAALYIGVLGPTLYF